MEPATVIYLCKRLKYMSCLHYNINVFLPALVRNLIVYPLLYSILRYGIALLAHSPLVWHNRINSILNYTLKSVTYTFHVQ